MNLMNLFLLFSFGIYLTGAQSLPAPTNINITIVDATSFTITWSMTNDQNYIVTWNNNRTNMTANATVATNSYTVTGLNGMDNYYVTVTANNSIGSATSAPYAVYDPPMNAPMFNVTNITNESFIVRWDAVNDLFPVTYFIRWYGADGNNEQAYVNTAQSYTATGLNNNTSYNVTVAASNTCCGEGPVSKVIVVMTNGLPSPTTTTTNTTVTPSVTTNPTPGGDSGAHRISLSNGVITVTACVITFIMTLIAA